jgi:hypothetical protein
MASFTQAQTHTGFYHSQAHQNHTPPHDMHHQAQQMWQHQSNMWSHYLNYQQQLQQQWAHHPQMYNQHSDQQSYRAELERMQASQQNQYWQKQHAKQHQYNGFTQDPPSTSTNPFYANSSSSNVNSPYNSTGFWQNSTQSNTNQTNWPSNANFSTGTTPAGPQQSLLKRHKGALLAQDSTGTGQYQQASNYQLPGQSSDVQSNQYPSTQYNQQSYLKRQGSNSNSNNTGGY